MRRTLICGAGGFIGGWLVKRLKADGHYVAGADIKRPEFGPTAADYFHHCDLRELRNCEAITRDVSDVYNLAADMGGIGFIQEHLADVARNNALINLNMLEACRKNGVKRFFFSSSACIYPKYKQLKPDAKPLQESDAFPADPEDGYGVEKLFTEQMCAYYKKDYKMDVRIARFFNVYGPMGAFDGGREKSPAAICRKVALAKDGDEIEIWGDGKATRTYLYITDCVEGIVRIMNSGYSYPLNLGTTELVTIDQLVNLVAGISGKCIKIKHNESMPQGVRGRNADILRVHRLTGWEPTVKLVDGLRETYQWIEKQVMVKTT